MSGIPENDCLSKWRDANANSHDTLIEGQKVGLLGRIFD